MSNLTFISKTVVFLCFCFRGLWASEDLNQPLEDNSAGQSRRLIDYKRLGDGEVMNIAQAAAPLNNLLQSGVSAHKILLVLDVDGVLTNEPTPSCPIPKARLNVIDWVKYLKSQGVLIVTSSAWNAQFFPFMPKGFRETLGRLRCLDLAETLSLSDGEETRVTELSFSEEIKKTVYYHKNGNCCSVTADESFIKRYNDRYAPIEVEDIFFRSKALAPYLVLSSEQLDQVSHVFFFDDGFVNTDIFNQQAHELCLYPKANIYIYELSHPKNEKDERIEF